MCIFVVTNVFIFHLTFSEWLMVFSVACNGWKQSNLPSLLHFYTHMAAILNPVPKPMEWTCWHRLKFVTLFCVRSQLLRGWRTAVNFMASCHCGQVAVSVHCWRVSSGKGKKHPSFPYGDVIFNLILNYMLNIQMWLEGILASALSPDTDHLSYSV